MKALALGILLLGSPAYACVDSTVDIRDDIILAIQCYPFTVQPGVTRCKLTILNENTCLGLFIPARTISTTYHQSDPGGLVTGEVLNPGDIKIRPHGTRRFYFRPTIDDLSTSMYTLAHVVGNQLDTGVPFEVFKNEMLDAP